ncbi:SWEET sugar transporter [Corchorus olitorius]|uniref:Bidirectional sugar transporter SWEET n=1 Tax=Corchorus olitorius TaxID=93759 RepID=A0A1R3JUU8_9ROSI|nr:SWEET sugar transporter [Corchorus olitorius]
MGLAHNIVGIIGNVISFGLFLSPVPTFWRICKNKSVEEFQPYPYIATVLNCLIWTFYGLPLVVKDNIFVTTSNGICLAIELIYLAIYCCFANDKKKRVIVFVALLVEVIYMAGIVAISMLAIEFKYRAVFVGVLCVVFNIIMYLSPLAIWEKVMRTRSVEYMPFWLSVGNFVNGCCWSIYALIQFDFFIIFNHGIGAIFGAIQLIIYAYYYYFSGKRITDAKDDGKPSEIQLTDSV